MEKGKPGVMIYFETGKAIKHLDYETKGRLFEAIMEYAEFGVVPKFDGVLYAVWPFVADKIDRDSARYERTRQARAEAGRKGGLVRASKLKQDETTETIACCDKQIKPTETAYVAATENTYAPVLANEGIMEKEERNNGLTVTNQTVPHISCYDDSDFEVKRMEAIKRVEAL